MADESKDHSSDVEYKSFGMFLAGPTPSFSDRPQKSMSPRDRLTQRIRRQAMVVTSQTKMGASDVLQALYPVLLRHGSPEYIRSENGSELAPGSIAGLASTRRHQVDLQLSEIALGERIK